MSEAITSHVIISQWFTEEFRIEKSFSSPSNVFSIRIFLSFIILYSALLSISLSSRKKEKERQRDSEKGSLRQGVMRNLISH